MNQLNDAIIVASNSHKGQVDKAGEPYILHPLRVMLQMDTDEERIVAVLHDFFEDSPLSPWELWFKYNIPKEIITAVNILTKIDWEDNIQYYNRIKQNPLCMKVKLADIRDNLDEKRLSKLDKKVRDRLVKKYKKALEVLNDNPKL